MTALGNTSCAKSFFSLVVLLLCCQAWSVFSGTIEKTRQAPALPRIQRTPWTTSRITGSPDPPPLHQVSRVFPKLAFKDPVELELLPGSDRLVLAELGGKILSFDKRSESAQPDLMIDLPKNIPGVTQVYGLTFHPRFQENRFVYICYVLKEGLPDGTRVSRFTISAETPPRINAESEKIIISWLSGGHNGGCLKFGPDGYLYIATGDGAGPNPPDPLKTGQDVSDLLSSILRIDVDHEGRDRAYRTPPDNPFLTTEGARPEIWAYGFRNPWKMSFDRKTGDLWTADVGWELWELVYRVGKGGNYGWSVVEGRQSINPEGKQGPTPIQAPTVDHSHSEAASITGGFVYHGRKNPDLQGAYIYGDWETRKIFAFHYDGQRVVWKKQLLDTSLRVIAFAEDADGELFIVDYQGGIYQLGPSQSKADGGKFPRRLSETGLFASTRRLTPAPGLVPYSINAEAWSDYAYSDRYLGLPGHSQIEVTNEKGAFPKDAVLLKNLYLHDGNPPARRIESQVLHFDGQNWNGYSYRWNHAQTDADLVPPSGADETFVTKDPSAPGGERIQNWRFASRSECLRCHNPWAGPPLAFNALQLNRLHRSGQDVKSQLEALAQMGPLSKAFVAPNNIRVSNPYDPLLPLADRARSYLHVNCSHCHRENAGGAVNSWMNYELKLDKMSLVSARPTQGAFGLDPAFVIAPSDPCHSVLYYRISKVGPGRMPHLASTLVDSQGIRLIHDWISGLEKKPPGEAISPEGKRTFEPGEIEKLAKGSPHPDSETGTVIQRMMTSTSGALALMTAVGNRELPSRMAREVIAEAARSPDLQIRDLFERFLPEAERKRKTMGAVLPSQILSARGDPLRGKKAFFENAGIQCARCHRVRGDGGDFGPDLSQIGRKYNAAELLENIIHPSKVIDPNYIAYSVRLKDGQTHTGLLVKKTTEEIVIKESQTEEAHLAVRDVERLQPQAISAMPEGLLQGLTAEETADLLAYLCELQ